MCADVEPGFLSKVVPSEAPEQGQEWQVIARDYEEQIMPGITHWQSPSFFAYYPCNATFEGGLADLHAAMISNPGEAMLYGDSPEPTDSFVYLWLYTLAGFNWTVSPSVTELEIITLDWMAKMLGLSQDFHSNSTSGKGGGIILGSASEVALTVAIAAREKMLAILDSKHEEQDSPTSDTTNALAIRRGTLTSKLTMYGTTQTHSIAAKAALILGLDYRPLQVYKEDDFALRGSTLETAIAEDEQSGRVPFMLIASLGTTSSGAVDRLDEITDVVKRVQSKMWVHVDAAWAGVALSLPEARVKMFPDAIDQVDSFSTNYHKVGVM